MRQYKQLEETASSREQTISSLESLVEKRDKEISTLKQQLRAQERKFMDEINTRKTKMDAMSRELESKAGIVARLVTEMHSLKMKLRDRRSSDSPHSSAELTRNSLSSAESPRTSWSDERLSAEGTVKPVPPKQKQPKFRRRLSGHHTTVEPSQIPAVKVRSASNRRLSGEVLDPDVPDPTPFLLMNRENSNLSSSVHAKLPLPPIRMQPSSEQIKPEAVLPQNADSLKFVHHPKPKGSKTKDCYASSPELEMEVLAVDQVMNRTSSLRRAHDYRSSDY